MERVSDEVLMYMMTFLTDTDSCIFPANLASTSERMKKLTYHARPDMASKGKLVLFTRKINEPFLTRHVGLFSWDNEKHQ